jgi:hypothetical protein
MVPALLRLITNTILGLQEAHNSASGASTNVSFPTHHVGKRATWIIERCQEGGDRNPLLNYMSWKKPSPVLVTRTPYQR